LGYDIYSDIINELRCRAPTDINRNILEGDKMVYVIDFEDGKHKFNQQVAQLVGNEVFQPLEFEGECDEEDFIGFKEYIQRLDSGDKIIVFMENTDGPSFGNGYVLAWLRENVNVFAYVARTI